jgi:Holliday junction DNA helicase RuvA
MITYISGKLASKNPTQAVVEVNQVGYLINIPVSTYEKLADQGEYVIIYTHLHVTQDKISLYGFHTTEERDLFEILLTVTGIGPRTALTVLSGMSFERFIDAIKEQDIPVLTKISGIGKKTAERLIFELKDHFVQGKFSGMQFTEYEGGGIWNIRNEAIKAIMSLGYSRSQVLKTFERIEGDLKEEKTLEGLIRAILKKI